MYLVATILLSLAANLLGGIGVKADAECLQGWTFYNGKCYGFENERLSWPEAQTFCRLHGGILAEPRTPDTVQFLVAMAKQNRATTWLGATDAFHEGIWEWSSNHEQLSASPGWSPRQPDNHGGIQDCLIVWIDYAGIQDAHCFYQTSFICEASPLQSYENTPDNC